jgi:hypothetical protein
MNMRPDELAEEYRANNQGPTRSAALSKSNTEPIPGQCIQLIVNGFAVTQSHAKWIRYQITGYVMRKYLQERHDWDDPTWDTIDWHGFEKAIRSRPPTMQRRISKFVNGCWWNVGKQRRRINAKDFILCPRCKLCRETTEHVLYCSRLSPETQTFRATLNDTINSVTPDTITSMILSILRRLSVEPHNSPRPRIPETLSPKVRNKLRKAIQDQAAMGWSLTLRGYLAKSWTNAYCRLSGNEIESDTTKKWRSTVINCLWTYAFSMWKLRCQILHDDDDGLKFTKLDNEIRALYLEKETFLPVDRNLFSLPLARVLAKTAETKEAHLLGFQAAKQRLEAFNDPDNLENIVNPANRRKRKKTAEKAKRPKQATTTTTNTTTAAAPTKPAPTEPPDPPTVTMLQSR